MLKRSFLLGLLMIMLALPCAVQGETVEAMLRTCANELGYTASEGGYSKYGDWAGGAYKEWCSEYISWCAQQTQDETGHEIVDVFYPYHDTCKAGVKWYTQQGRYITTSGEIKGWGEQFYWEDGTLLAEKPYVPQRGDLIYIEWYQYDRIDHVGIVEYVTHSEEEGYIVHTIEGNNKILGPEPTNVARYSYRLDDPTIRGYGVLDESAIGTTMRSGSEGEPVQSMQELLIAMGYLEMGNDTGLFGDSTKAAVMAFQKAEGLKATGVADYETQKRLEEVGPDLEALAREREAELAALGAGQDFFETYDITDEAAVWEMLTRDITVLDVGSNEKLYLRKYPNGPRLSYRDYDGFLYGESVAVRVLEIKDGWALIEGYNMRNELMRGYVRERALKTATPNQEYGIVVDKLTQTLYLFKEGKLVTTLMVSTGLPSKEKPYNETAQGEYMLISPTGGFWSGDLYCDMAIRFNGGDLLHLVPCLINGDGTKNFASFEKLLGSRASHGCIRTQRVENADGYNMQWIWDNIPMRTKILIWDDAGRPLPYPDADTKIYYNPDGGKLYHADAYCSSVKERYLPLTEIAYEALDEADYEDLTACGRCTPPKRKSEIDAHNAKVEAKGK